MAEFDSSIIGFIAVDQKSETVASVRRMSVDTCFQGRRKHIATKLFQEAFKFCQECGYAELVVEFPGTRETKTYRLRRCDIKPTRQEFFVARQGWNSRGLRHPRTTSALRSRISWPRDVDCEPSARDTWLFGSLPSCDVITVRRGWSNRKWLPYTTSLNYCSEQIPFGEYLSIRRTVETVVDFYIYHATRSTIVSHYSCS